MENNELPAKARWYSIKEAAEYLDVGEPTLYRWMREGKITYRKVGDSTRFWQEDLDSVMEVFHSSRDVEKAREICPICRHDELIEGWLQGRGWNHFYPKKTKLWTFKSSNIPTSARMCVRCGAVILFGDTTKLAALRNDTKAKARPEVEDDAPETLRK